MCTCFISCIVIYTSQTKQPIGCVGTDPTSEIHSWVPPPSDNPRSTPGTGQCFLKLLYTQSLLGKKNLAELLVTTKILLSNIVHLNDTAKICKVCRPEIVICSSKFCHHTWYLVEHNSVTIINYIQTNNL